MDAGFQMRMRTSVLYRTAALLLPAFPQIIREGLLQESRQYQDIDIEDRRAWFLRIAGDVIEDDVVVAPQSGSAVFGEADRFVAF